MPCRRAAGATATVRSSASPAAKGLDSGARATPAQLAGHSLGEYTALVASGAVSAAAGALLAGLAVAVVPIARQAGGAERLRRDSALHAELTRVDPQAGASILDSDGRRIVRALEVVELTGQPFAASAPRIGTPRWDTAIIGLDWDTAVLDDRLRRRTDTMFDTGLVDEVIRLGAAGLRKGVTASRALGYAQVLADLGGSLFGELMRTAVHRGVHRPVEITLGRDDGFGALRRRAGVEVDERLAVADAAREHGKILSHARRVERNVSHDQALTSLPTAALT